MKTTKLGLIFWLLPILNSLLGICAQFAGDSKLNTNGFLERDHLISAVHSHSWNATILIPQMNFVCNGTIIGFRVAVHHTDGGDQYCPVIQVWRPTADHSHYYQAGAGIAINSAACLGGLKEEFKGVFHCDLNDNMTVSVQPGDVLGLDLPPANPSLYFATVIDLPKAYVFQRNVSYPVVLCDNLMVNKSLPQINIQVVPGCTRGFPHIPVSRVNGRGEYSTTVSVLIPEMNFTCCNKTIASFTVTGRTPKGQWNPEIQIWRENSSHPSIYHKIHSGIPVHKPGRDSEIVCANGTIRIASRTYLCILNTKFQLPVEMGYILGLELPPTSNHSFDIYFTSGGPTNYVFLEKLSSTINLSSSDSQVQQLIPQISFSFTTDQCTIGFPNVTLRKGSSRGGKLITTRLIPELRFGCTGTVIRLTVAIKDHKGDQIPRIQFWRENQSVANVYYKAGSDIPVVGNRSICVRHVKKSGIFSCTLNETFQATVESGDILGIELPAQDNVDFEIYFTDGGPTNYIIEGRASNANLPEAHSVTKELPQISLLVVLGEQGDQESQSFSGCDDTDGIVISTPISPQPKTSPISITGIVVGITIVVLLAVCVALLLVLIARQQHKKGHPLYHRFRHDQGVIIHNPTYDAPSIRDSTSNAFATISYLAVSSVQNNGQAAHMPDYDEISEGSNDEADGIRPSAYISETPQILPGAIQPSTDNYETEIYVPSKEQRAILQNHIDDETYTYEALEKEQQNERSGEHRELFKKDDTYWDPADDVNELYRQLYSKKYREIVRHQVEVKERIGSGQFGEVSKGVWQSPMGAMDVAVKQLQSGASQEEKVKFLQEAAINGQFRHPNVVQLMGVVTVGEPTMIVLEILSNGNLRDALIKLQMEDKEAESSRVDQILLLKFCQHIASGMAYLASKSFVHRDLAARNILVSGERTCKVSDFGMSQKLKNDHYYVSHGGKIPVKWTAPEAIHCRKYSTASDVWSFGCVMYEIWSLGHKPFEEYSNTDVIRMVDEGYRLHPPPGLSKELYKIMIQCWQPERSRRPTFLQLVELLSRIDFELFVWEEEDLIGSDPQVKVIGAPLEVAKNLYPELQRSYYCIETSTI